MAVSKDIEKGTWTSQVWVEDWQGKKKHKKKRGFATKKEALEWEHSILLAAKADMNMKLADFVDLYFRDKETELKARTVRNKRYMIEQHVAPMLGDKPMNGITPADIIQWQNYIRSKGFKETYQRMLQNQLTVLFTHATKIYNLKDNPCAKVKRIGKADADKKQLQFWTLDEFNKLNLKHNIGNFSYNKDYSNSSFPWLDSIIKKKINKDYTFCYSDNNKTDIASICSLSNDFTVVPNIILKNNFVSNVKDNLQNGSIISITINDSNKSELPILINYIISKGYEIKTLNEHLSE